ncbi:hypothetical protein Pla108_24510 [Botrimarina colliarenosi]|uniref:Uncharacterized protein n=1 Tax=Botrimarina colliarenosi TaxID=2528001 RepID=A0A5C6ABD7_9BACT|nr:hypothetical protein Pla108_24510 [Botrimarina colliarenosi]
MLLVALAAVGCSTLLSVNDKPLPVGSPLRTAGRSSDGVRFEVYWATLPPDVEADDQASLWRFVQEERLDEGLRARLQRNGLRAGVVGGVPPQEIMRLLDPRPSDAPDDADGTVSRLSAPTGVKKQEMTVRPGEPAQVNASEVSPEATLLLADERGPWGETFQRVQAIYKVGVEPRRGGGHLISVAPELHHGEARMRWVADGAGAITRPKATREERAFPDLRIEAPLMVGEMLLVTSLSDSQSRLGDFFHRADGEVSGARKAILVRLVQTPPEADFAAAAADRLDF